VHPVAGKTIQQILDHLMTPETYVAIAGIDASVNRRFAEALLAYLPGRLLAAPAVFTDEPAVADFNSPALPRGIASKLYLQYGALPKRGETLPAELLISDFWFDQFTIWSAVHLPARWQPLYHQTFVELKADLLPPKLILHLSNGSAASEYDRGLSMLLLQERSAPVLKVGDETGDLSNADSAPWQAAIAEAVGALQSLM
jgi:hypothetical protein